jgi:hypothetical protein
MAYGTAKQRSTIAKKAAAGKDIGKPDQKKLVSV